ncbi:universal stress protein [Furfurilactobacillus curtus]|uniref:UspA domain-containing protein n=1 Tax=Furfurilactobacillus curtus TaxID=1746200 RepID=A0ABQ5JSP0_9LACO
MNKVILVAVDASSEAGKVLSYAAKLAKLDGLNLRLLSVIHSTSNPYNISVTANDIITRNVTMNGEIEHENDHLLQNTHNYLEQLAHDQGLNPSDLDIQVLEGNTKQRLVDAVSEPDVTELVMGALGTHRLTGNLLGSVADYVIRQSAKTVTVVK